MTNIQYKELFNISLIIKNNPYDDDGFDSGTYRVDFQNSFYFFKSDNMIIETKEYANGVQVVHEFPNGYGASVIRHDFSYGGKDGLWEMAVLKEGDLCYNTHITNDVIGH